MTAAVAVTRPVLAQQMQTHLPPGVAAKPNGPVVFLDYDKDEIDFAYDQPPARKLSFRKLWSWRNVRSKNPVVSTV
jgi:hypothetical protein